MRIEDCNISFVPVTSFVLIVGIIYFFFIFFDV